MDGCLFRLICALLVAWQSVALADQVNNEWLSSTRALSMGNVGIASAEDSVTTMFYNPAALTKNKRTTLELFNPQVEFGTGVFKVSNTSTSYGKNMGLESVQPLLQAHPHKASYLGYSLYPNVSAQNFGFGIGWKEQAVSYINSQDKLEYHSKYLMIPTMGISMNLLGNRFRLGAAVRGIQATENNRVVDATATGIGYKLDPQQGFGIGLDAGAMLSLPWAGLPTLGFVARNLGDTSFSQAAPYPRSQGTPTAHDKVKMTYDTGLAIQPKMGQRNSFTLAADFRDALNVSKTNMLRHLNVGSEIGYGKVFFFRFGFSQGYLTGGFGLNSKFGSIDIGTYGEELDARNFREIEDRRVSIRFAVKF
ncbi:MAG: hypothetical protein ACXVBE_03955 [Bdellovibrionota bacterium]